MFCPKCGNQVGPASFCPNCGAAVNQAQSMVPQRPMPKKKTKMIYQSGWFWVVIVLVFITTVGKYAAKSSPKTPEEAANRLNSQIATTTKPVSQATPSATESPKSDVVLEEINPEIPLGTTYQLGQGTYECGVDIPAGRYIIEWVEGNQFGGSISSKNRARYLDTFVSIDPQEQYTCLLSAGDIFEISLATMRFTKITSLPNDNYLQADGSYLLGSGYFFVGIDIPEGKYNVTAVGGNPYGISIHTRSNSFVFLDQNETYNNLMIDHPGSAIEISLGTALFEVVK